MKVMDTNKLTLLVVRIDK